MLYDLLKTLIRSPRFYVVFLVVAATGTTIRMLPVDKQQAICNAYEVLVANFQQLPVSPVTDAAAAGPPDRLPGGETNPFFVEQTRHLLCDPVATASTDVRPGYFEAAIGVVPIALALSVLLCGLLPAGTREMQSGAACETGRTPSPPPAASGGGGDEEVRRLERDLARARHACGRLSLQARQMNVALVYDEKEDIDLAEFPKGLDVHERVDMPAVHQKFGNYKGVSAMVYCLWLH